VSCQATAAARQGTLHPCCFVPQPSVLALASPCSCLHPPPARLIAALACPRPAAWQVSKHDSLQRYQLYLVDWGYNTPAERAAAAAHPRVEVVDIARFSQLAGVPAPASAGR